MGLLTICSSNVHLFQGLNGINSDEFAGGKFDLLKFN